MCDQSRMIRNNKWITKLELESIRRKALKKDIEVNNYDNTGERFYQYEENICESKATQADTKNLQGEKETMIEDILTLMKDTSRIELRGF